MNIQVSLGAADWYKEELGIDGNAYLRLYVRYGFGGFVPGFSLGIKLDSPEEIHASHETDNITFFIEEKDEWYFGGKDLHISLNTEKDEPEFHYV